MIRPVLSLLAVLPMLMPPGMCLCQLVPARAGGFGSYPTSAADRDPIRHADGCRCESCREPSAPTEPANGTRPDLLPTDGPRPAPLPGWPCCPAVLNVAGVNTAVLVTPVLLPCAFPAAPVDFAAAPPCSPFTRPDRDSAPSYDPPLFICHCALLI